MHIKAHAGRGLTNANIEEIVTNISPNPQSWRYISFSTAERSPKCNSTQEKSPSEQCVHTGKWKQHQDTLEKKTFLLCAPSWVFPIETGATINTSWGQNNGFSPWWWRYACAGLKLEWIPFHKFHIFCQSFVSFEWRVTQSSNIRSPFQIFDHLTSKSSFILFAYETFASMHCNGAVLSAEQRWISGSLIWMIMRAPGPSGFVVLILNSQPNLLLPFRGRSFLCPPILSDLANVDLVDDQPSN